MARNGESHGTDAYLEAVYEMHEEGAEVVQARLAERLGVSRAAVSEQIARLTRMKLVQKDAGRVINLTDHGRAVAEDAVRRHRMAERFLIDVLKLPWHKAHEEAERFQDALSEEVEQRIMAMLGGPATCPHGNPIPGTGATLSKDLRKLDEFTEGDVVVLERLTEDVELKSGVLEYFEQHGLMPGNTIRIDTVAPDGTMSLEVDGTRSSLGAELADNLWVRPAVKRRASARR